MCFVAYSVYTQNETSQKSANKQFRLVYWILAVRYLSSDGAELSEQNKPFFVTFFICVFCGECGCICMISICVADNQLWLLWLNEGYECLWMTIWPHICMIIICITPHISVWLLTTKSNQCECLAISVYVWQSKYVSEYATTYKAICSLYTQIILYF